MTLPRKSGYVVTRQTVQQFFSSSTPGTSALQHNTTPLATVNTTAIISQLPNPDPFSHVNVTIPTYTRSIDNNSNTQFFTASPYVAAYPPARFVTESEILPSVSSIEATIDHLPSLHWNWANTEQHHESHTLLLPQNLIDSGETQIRTAESLSFEEIAQKKHAVTASPFLPLMLQSLDPYKSHRLPLCDKFKQSLPTETESFDLDLSPFYQEDSSLSMNIEYVAKLNQAKQKYEAEIAKLNAASNEYCNQIMISLKEQSLRRPILDEEPSIKIAIVQSKFYNLKRQLKQYTIKGLHSLQMENVKLPKRKNLPAEACDILLKWFLAHLTGPAGPYPSEDDKIHLAKLTNLTIKQINYWFSNKRMRYKRKCMAQGISNSSSSTNSGGSGGAPSNNTGQAHNTPAGGGTSSQSTVVPSIHSTFDFQPTAQSIRSQLLTTSSLHSMSSNGGSYIVSTSNPDSTSSSSGNSQSLSISGPQ
eukprot:TRINITY_DN6672_c0_g3_i1.p1 TRINITY_DN6672_c0_g3~~TRINITY_DN6672_c0_g3_i1.p1  ORF type:complete len:475 (-),score=106.17 TRINITY_DN6672_c0_g3_i1:238-1662(-)